MQVTVRYLQEIKVSLKRATGNDDDRFENTLISVGYNLQYPFADPPEDSTYETWKSALHEFIGEKTEEVREIVREEIQRDYDKFLEENGPEA
jgi:hypothetical protein